MTQQSCFIRREPSISSTDMFYTQDILRRRKGALSVVWLAGTLGTRNPSKRLSKKDLEHVNVSQMWFVFHLSIQVILHLPSLYSHYLISPPEPMSLRLTSQLLVGVSRVYHQQCHFYWSTVFFYMKSIDNSIYYY